MYASIHRGTYIRFFNSKLPACDDALPKRSIIIRCHFVNESLHRHTRHTWFIQKLPLRGWVIPLRQLILLS